MRMCRERGRGSGRGMWLLDPPPYDLLPLCL